jgi:diguanylate cyclase (GGDEF)-like protein
VTDAIAGSGVDPARLYDFAERWASVLAWTSYVPMDRAERLHALSAFTTRLAAALVAEEFSEKPAYEVGTGLVKADFAAPEALGATIHLIDEHLLAVAGVDAADPRGRTRLARLLGALATGYSGALRDRTLDEQEAIQAAALMAREQAEHALRDSEARFRYAAMHDPLTGMPNRALLTDRLEDIFQSADPTTRIALCFIDLDSFKAVNDSLGHGVGDRLLMAVAERLSRLAAGIGQVAARVGGDEFVLLIEGTHGAEDAIKAAETTLEVLAEPYHIDDTELPMTASIGIVERAVSDTSPIELIRAADITLHWAKSDGKSRWSLFDAERNEREVARYSLRTAMPSALERDEFTLAYQPIIGLTDGTLDGVEALARWQHPEHGLLMPDRFISLAEDSGLIVALGRRVLEKACEQAARWWNAYLHAPFVSVNLAVAQIRHPRLLGDVAAVLSQTGLPPHKLQLEITESAIMNDDAETLTRLHELADLGVRLAIDDFGTGYSNLANLRTLPVHTLKLAGKFVDDLRRQEARAPLARSRRAGPVPEAAFLRILVNLAHTYGLTVTAEHVETRHQAEVLRAVGCEAGQGYYLGYPTDPHTIERLLDDAV